MARDPKPALFALAANGVIRLREEGDRFKIARPVGHENRAFVYMDREGNWVDEQTGRKGIGLFNLAQYLDIELGEVTSAF